MASGCTARQEEYRRFLQARQQRVAALRAELAARYPQPTGLVFEIGCGHGHYLTAYAAAHPRSNCLGIDLVTRRIAKAQRKRDKQALPNLHFIKADIREMIEAWPARLAIERTFILFPDPWPKKRHAKHRILQPALLDALARVAAPGAPLQFRTDHEANFSWGLAVIARHPLWEIRDDAPWPLENPSYFQQLFGNYRSLTALRVDPHQPPGCRCCSSPATA
jgi:tRNA (guanine-N7-)-methyltransferase